MRRRAPDAPLALTSRQAEQELRATLGAWARAYQGLPAVSRRFFTLAFVAGMGWASCQAAAQTRLITSSLLAPRAASAAQAAAQAPKPPVAVWVGLDVDGDGQPDFGNPTGQGVRIADAFGSGAFGASRDGGARRHEGVDYDDQPGQPIKAPMSGFVTKIGYAYPDDESLRYVQISNPALGYVARVFYVDPQVAEGQPVRLGQPIGRAQSLQARYAGITNHVHLEIARADGDRIDATRLIAARLQAPPPARG